MTWLLDNDYFVAYYLDALTVHFFRFNCLLLFGIDLALIWGCVTFTLSWLLFVIISGVQTSDESGFVWLSWLWGWRRGLLLLWTISTWRFIISLDDFGVKTRFARFTWSWHLVLRYLRVELNMRLCLYQRCECFLHYSCNLLYRHNADPPSLRGIARLVFFSEVLALKSFHFANHLSEFVLDLRWSLRDHYWALK